MGVDVDEARRHERAVGVDHLAGRRLHLPDFDDAPSLNGHVCGPRLGAGAVDDLPALDDDVEHRASLPVGVTGQSSSASPGP
jgi:hypothetical protein